MFFFFDVISGEVLAMQFANLGAKLILSARNKDELERVKQNILSKFGYCFSCCLNFSFREEVEI